MTKSEVLEILIGHYKANKRWMDSIDNYPSEVKDYFGSIAKATEAAKRVLKHRKNDNITPCGIKIMPFEKGGMTKCYHQTQCCMESECKIVVQRKSKFNLESMRS